MAKKKENKQEVYDLQEQAAKIWDMYQKGLDYQVTSGLAEKIPLCVRFYEGDQWAKSTEKTKNFPRPVINVTRMIVRNKKAGVLSNDTSIVYSCDDPEKSRRFSNFGAYITKELGQKSLDRKAVGEAAIKGTCVYHYYWDADAVGKRGNLDGAVRGEIIDPLNIFFENPNNDNEQSQKWIIIRSRVSVETAKAMADEDVDQDLITSDENESKYNEKEQDEKNKCTVLTRYFRKDGEVYFEKSLKGTVIVKARPLHPDISKAKKILAGDEDIPNEEGYEAKNDKPYGKIANLYPIAVGNYEKKDKSIFGIGEVEGVIPNQRSINTNLGLQLLNVQSVWGGKWLVHPNALRGQKITNDPCQVLVDYSATNGGIKKVTEQVYNDVPLKILEETMTATRVVTGATEVMTGETIGANTSGAAILQLQSQAQKPIEELQQSFWETKVKCGKILEMFYKLYYEDVEYTYKSEDQSGMTPVNPNGMPLERIETDTFRGSEFMDDEFEVTVEVIAGAKGTEVSLVQSLDNLLQQNAIDIVTYFELYPHNALPNKSEILQAVKDKQNSQMVQMQAQIQQYEMQLQNAAALFEKSRSTIQNAVNILKENQSLQEMIVNLRTEYANKINQANQINTQTTNDARELAKELYFATNTPKGNTELPE